MASGPASAGAGGSNAASEAPSYGLYRASAFVVGQGAGNPGCTTRHARWYFAGETVALPLDPSAVPQPARGMRADAELAAWAQGCRPGSLTSAPPLVWVAAPQVIADAKLAADATTLAAGASSWRVELTPKSPLIHDFFGPITAQWFAQRDVRVRATIDGDGALLRTIWPQDFRLPTEIANVDPALTLPLAPEALRALVRRDPHGGAQSPFEVASLWSRRDAPDLPAGRPVLGIILNGAQGDDDEAHGGHFAVVTGRTRSDGEIGDWLVNNFYSLDTESEKSIIAAPVPLDNYLADLNGGQSYYRPSVLAVAVLASERAANVVQDALNRTYVQFYRHQIAYHHASMNCTGISVDVLRALGLDVRGRGPSAPLLATIALPWLVVRRGWAKARVLFDYLTEDQTRLLPAAAFEEAVAAMTRAIAGDGHAGGLLDGWLAEDIEALLLLRFPQFPTARPWGDAPVVTFAEYRARWPADARDARIFPVPLRPFPDELRDPDLVREKPLRSTWAAIGWLFVVALALIAGIGAFG